MKSILFITLIVSLNLFCQDKRYTNGTENGFMWLDFEKRMIASNQKAGYLSSMLENEKIKALTSNNKDDLWCGEALRKLQLNTWDKPDLEAIIKMIDLFYNDINKLVIPIRYAYCFCIYELAGAGEDELNFYKKKLLDFCSQALEK